MLHLTYPSLPPSFLSFFPLSNPPSATLWPNSSFSWPYPSISHYSPHRFAHYFALLILFSSPTPFLQGFFSVNLFFIYPFFTPPLHPPSPPPTSSTLFHCLFRTTLLSRLLTTSVLLTISKPHLPFSVCHFCCTKYSRKFNNSGQDVSFRLYTNKTFKLIRQL